MMKKAMSAAIALCMAACANAQAIYRCGNSYGDARCPDSKVIEPARAPTAAEVASAREEVRRELKMAEELATERKAEEARWRRDDFDPAWNDNQDGTARPHLASAKKASKRAAKKPSGKKAPAKPAKKTASA